MPTILGANTLSSGYNVANSLRFNDDSSDYLNRTPGSAGNRRTFTISCWIKRGQTTTLSNIMSAWASNADSGHFLFRFDSAERLDVSTWSTNLLTTTAVFRDPSAWYHVVCAIDTTSGTADNRVRLYVNGVEQSCSPGSPGVEICNNVDDDCDPTTSDSDADGDGWSDYDEIQCNSDPMVSTDTPGDADDDGTCDLMESSLSFESYAPVLVVLVLLAAAGIAISARLGQKSLAPALPPSPPPLPDEDED